MSRNSPEFSTPALSRGNLSEHEGAPVRSRDLLVDDHRILELRGTGGAKMASDVLLRDASRAYLALERIVELASQKYRPEDKGALLTAIRDIAEKAIRG